MGLVMATNASDRMNMQCIAVHITLESWAPQNKAIGVLADILVMEHQTPKSIATEIREN